ncbi:conserved hypothetical protein [Luteimonas sp. 9C]|uniref:hypothetical protein n=1 Tax=Luteimonas sp. 9C TaxID=2653148 RepID=UPI0012F36784|nr:hypothetical protein [Luteimonas sp. 9C]VXB70223.1 conserved hypothetical protein [Luteimonas sp. 9C]
MDPIVAGLLATLVGAIVGGAVSFLLNRQLHAQQLERLRTEHKTEFAAEDTARHFLSHRGYTDRSFDVLRKHLGGFEDDELRRILVRAGAVRTYRDDGGEWWRLLSRMDEYIELKTRRADGAAAE